MDYLDLEVLGIDNRGKLPIGFEKDRREQYLAKNRDFFGSLGLKMEGKLTQAEFRHHFKVLQAFKVQEHYENEIIPSSGS